MYRFFSQKRLFPVRCRVFVCLAAALMLLGGQSASAEEIIRINGSGAAVSLAKHIVLAYSKLHPDVKIVMGKPLGSSGAIKALLAGSLDIVLSSKPLTDSEMQQGAKRMTLGMTPIAIIAGRNVPPKGISTRDLEEIYAGHMRKWPNGEDIRIVLRPLEEIETKILRGLSPGMDVALSQAFNRKGMLLAITDPESNQLVSRTSGSIGTGALCGVMADKVSVKILPLNGVSPTIEAMSKGKYPLRRDIDFVITDKLPESARQFIKFVYSKEGRAIARKYGLLVQVKS